MRDALARRAESTPDATALIDAADGGSWSYGDLDAEVRETASQLAARGIEPGDRVAVLLESRPAFVRLVHATARIGAVLVLLNAKLARPTLADQRERVEPDLLVCSAETIDDAGLITGETPIVTVDLDEIDAARKDVVAPLDTASSPAVEPYDWHEDDRRVILFTSGTTGDPKAVPLTAGNLRASATASAFRLGVLPDDRWLDPLPLYHMGGLAPVIRSALYGTTVVLQRTFDAEETARVAAEYGATGISVVPTMLRRLLDADEPLPDSLRFVLTGGAPTPPELVERCERAGVPVCPTYGMTETASQVATAAPGEAFDQPDSVGRPLDGTSVTVVIDDGEPFEPGKTGELVVSGPTVTPGYLDAPEEADDAFGPDGFRTGDVGFRDESGRLYVLNRRKDRIVTGGENVHPGEVIAALRDDPRIADAAVVGLPDPEWGERVAALVVPDGELDPRSIRERLGGRLARYKQPKTVALADELPRTISGTVERDAVRDRLRAAGVDLG